LKIISITDITNSIEGAIGFREIDVVACESVSAAASVERGTANTASHVKGLRISP